MQQHIEQTQQHLEQMQQQTADIMHSLSVAGKAEGLEVSQQAFRSLVHNDRANVDDAQTELSFESMPSDSEAGCLRKAYSHMVDHRSRRDMDSGIVAQSEDSFQ